MLIIKSHIHCHFSVLILSLIGIRKSVVLRPEEPRMLLLWAKRKFSVNHEAKLG